MQIQHNMATVIRVVKEARGESLAEFSAELEISRSSLQEYLSGHGNPNISTVEHLADKLGVDPIFLLTGTLSFFSVLLPFRVCSTHSTIRPIGLWSLAIQLLLYISSLALRAFIH